MKQSPQAIDHSYLDCGDMTIQQLQLLCGPLDEHIDLINRHYGVSVYRYGNDFRIDGEGARVAKAHFSLIQLKNKISLKKDVDPHQLKAIIFDPHREEDTLQAPGCIVKNASQQKYQEMIEANTVTFGIGPAGTGKTYIAVAQAVQAYKEGRIDKIVLTRPAVEAGESLGFLPGDLQQKIDPYLKPLLDALNTIMGPAMVQSLIAKNVVELAPLAFMRGRTLSRAYVVLDEAQNTTITQMKLFLTRLGENSKVIVTGDTSQIDLSFSQESGLIHAAKHLHNIPEIGFHFFEKSDIVRNPLIGKILEAYGDA